jgi:hypothetical protein
MSIFLLLGLNLLNVHSANLCEKGEEVAFACDVVNHKSVAVCKGKQDDIEHLEYRYGRRLNIEMKFKALESDQKKKFHRAEVVYANNASKRCLVPKGRFFLPDSSSRAGWSTAGRCAWRQDS